MRGALLLGRDPDDPAGEQGDRRVLAVSMSNLSAPVPSLLYEIAPEWVEGAKGELIETAKLTHIGESAAGGRDLLTERPREADDELSALDEAVLFLQEELADGPKLATEVTTTARTLGITARTLKRARQRAGVKASKQGFGRAPWEWSLTADHSGPGPLAQNANGPDGPECERPAFTGDSADDPPIGGQPKNDGLLWANEAEEALFARSRDEFGEVL
jgi:hypothetical protein